MTSGIQYSGLRWFEERQKTSDIYMLIFGTPTAEFQFNSHSTPHRILNRIACKHCGSSIECENNVRKSLALCFSLTFPHADKTIDVHVTEIKKCHNKFLFYLGFQGSVVASVISSRLRHSVQHLYTSSRQLWATLTFTSVQHLMSYSRTVSFRSAVSTAPRK